MEKYFQERPNPMIWTAKMAQAMDWASDGARRDIEPSCQHSQAVKSWKTLMERPKPR